MPPCDPDRSLDEHAPGPTRSVAPAVEHGRAAVRAAALELLAIPDRALERGWAWRDDEADVRYGLFRTIEATEAAAAELGRVLRAAGRSPTAGAARIAPATIARWDLHGVLAGLTDADLDRHAGGEWTIRETLAHVIGGQRAYGWFTAWWAARPPDEPTPDRVSDAVAAAAGLPEEEEEGTGTLAEIRDRLDAVLDASAGRLGQLDDGALARPARWAGIPVDVGFRLGRWSSHLVEHTIQIEKTLADLGRRPREVERLVRHLHATWGRLEALVFPGESFSLDPTGPACRSIEILGGLASELVADARSARVAALG